MKSPVALRPARDWLRATTLATEVLERMVRGWPEGNMQNAAYHALKDMDSAIFGDAPNHHRISLSARLIGLEHPNLWPKEAGPLPEADRIQRTPGLDPATVEACAKLVEPPLKTGGMAKARYRALTWAARRIRSLTAQPRGEKP